MKNELDRRSEYEEANTAYEWRRGNLFDPQQLDPFFDQESTTLNGNVSIGIGHGWEIACTQSDEPTRLEFYPDCPVLFLSFSSATDDQIDTPQLRSITPDAISVIETGEGSQIVINTSMKGMEIETTISDSGDIAEKYRPDFETMGRILDDSVMVVKEAAEEIGCNPRNITYLTRKGTLPSTKRGRELLIEADAVRNYKRSNRGPDPKRKVFIKEKKKQ